MNFILIIRVRVYHRLHDALCTGCHSSSIPMFLSTRLLTQIRECHTIPPFSYLDAKTDRPINAMLVVAPWLACPANFTCSSRRAAQQGIEAIFGPLKLDVVFGMRNRTPSCQSISARHDHQHFVCPSCPCCLHLDTREMVPSSVTGRVGICTDVWMNMFSLKGVRDSVICLAGVKGHDCNPLRFSHVQHGA